MKKKRKGGAGEGSVRGGGGLKSMKGSKKDKKETYERERT